MKKVVFTALAVFALVISFASVQSQQNASSGTIVSNAIIEPTL
jgi:hypothetical protein